ncbi:MAG: YfhO family protein, partial [Chloroflexota bacterium]|nr:YfhO family protein [Chloroflexota bacterium]
ERLAGIARPTRADAAAAFALLLLTLLATWDQLFGPLTVGLDSLTQAYPWYGYLGERLRDGDLPAWNPYSFSGTPFAADPLSGWSYLPAMVLFALLPVEVAAKVWVFAHLLTAGLAAYALARLLGMNVAGALMAAVAYEYSGPVYVRNFCCIAWGSVAVWLPVLLLSAELAIRAQTRPSRILWWGLGGFAFSQVLAAWPGQGTYYVLLAFGGYVLYRVLVCPPRDAATGIRGRVVALFAHTSAVVLIGAALAAAGLLPRIEYITLSNLAGGYVGGDSSGADVGGWSITRQWGSVLARGDWHTGGGVLLLALLAPLIARTRYNVPYLCALVLGALALSAKETTLVHRLAYLLLPGFERLHPHVPQRIWMLGCLATALLAGATASSLYARMHRWYALLAVPVGVILLVLVATKHVSLAPPMTVIALTSCAALVAACGITRLRASVPAGPLLLVLGLTGVAYVELLGAGRALFAERAYIQTVDRLRWLDLDRHYDPDAAGTWLRARAGERPFRYFGYAPSPGNERVAYTVHFGEPRTKALEVNNRSVLLHLQDVQGYNAVHLARYDEYMTALNGRDQNYHDAEIFEQGLDSPLLDMLGVRYIVLHASPNADTEDVRQLIREHPTVYLGSGIRVLENRRAFPRAWIVHEAQQARRGTALELLSSGAVDGKHTALIEEPSPKLDLPSKNKAPEQADIVSYEPERISIRTASRAAGLLVLSEVSYPAWRAYVDGRRVPVYQTNHLFRSVLLPKGNHLVEFRYESTTLRVGVAISSIAYLALGTLALAVLARKTCGGKSRRWSGVYKAQRSLGVVDPPC